MAFWPRRRWTEMTTKEFASIDPRTIAVLPVAAVEQHGPHLPVAVDAAINAAIVERMLELAPADLPVTVLPAMPVGKSVEHLGFPGTLTLSAETLIRLWTEIGESVARAGVRKLVIFNSHGGQPQVMEIVARELRIRCRMLVVGLSWWGLGQPEGLFPDLELEHGIHGGSVETSMMMHIAPGLVHDAERADFAPTTIEVARRFRHLRAEGGGVGYGWRTEDLHPSGACGNALDADAERGGLLVETAAERFVGLLREVDEFDFPVVAA
jgi:creatinine amidohydrolase